MFVQNNADQSTMIRILDVYIYIWRVGEFNITSTSWVLNLQIEALQRLELPWRHRFIQKWDIHQNCRVYGEIGLNLENSTFQTVRFWGFPNGELSFAHWPGLAQWRGLLPAPHPAAEPEVWPLQESKPEQKRAIHDHTLLFPKFSECRTACPHRHWKTNTEKQKRALSPWYAMVMTPTQVNQSSVFWFLHVSSMESLSQAPNCNALLLGLISTQKLSIWDPSEMSKVSRNFSRI